MGLFGFGSDSIHSNKRSVTRKVRSKKKRRVAHHGPRKKVNHRKTHRKLTSHRRIHKTKTGQPYIILASGKARFIKRKSARISKKRRGGRY